MWKKPIPPMALSLFFVTIAYAQSFNVGHRPGTLLMSGTGLAPERTPETPAIPTADRASVAATGTDPTGSWDTFVADVTIRRSMVSADGRPVGVPAPVAQYHWERSQAGAGWKTIITVVPVSPPTVRSLNGVVPLDHPPSVLRIEDDEDGTPPRVYNRNGEPVTLPTAEALRRLLKAPEGPGPTQPRPSSGPNPAPRPAVGPGREWIDAFIAMPAGRASRRQTLERQYGTAAGRVRGLDQFVTTSGDTTVEVLADPESLVPVEMNIARNGALVSHTTFRYGRGVGGSQVRRALRSEQLVADGTGERAVTDVEFTHVRLERRKGGAR